MIAILRLTNGAGLVTEAENIEVNQNGLFVVTKFESIDKTYKTFF
jgi:hypothetical protein